MILSDRVKTRPVVQFFNSKIKDVQIIIEKD
jgi:hypothetical protein